MLSQLGVRQTRAWGQLFSCYRKDDAGDSDVDDNGKEDDTPWSLIFSSEPCAIHYTQNDSDPAITGRYKRRSALTEDKLICWIGLDVQDGDMLLDVTPGSPNAGSWSKVQGQPRKIPTVGHRRQDYLTAQLMTDEKPTVALAALASA